MTATAPPRSALIQKDAGTRLALAMLITAVGGFLDVAGYQLLSRLYVSFMSGNSVHLGMSLAAADFSDAAMALALILAFILGSFTGEMITGSGLRRGLAALFAVECGLVLIACAITLAGQPVGALVLVAVAMGMQNAGHQTIDGVDTGRSYITGALVGLGKAIAGVMRGQVRPRIAFILLATWLSFLGGVILGSLTLPALGFVAMLALVAGLLAAISLFTFVRPLQR